MNSPPPNHSSAVGQRHSDLEVAKGVRPEMIQYIPWPGFQSPSLFEEQPYQPSSYNQPQYRPSHLHDHSISEPTTPYQQSPDPAIHSTLISSRQKHNKTICGIAKPTFWFGIALASVIIAGAVGGGVGGALASKNNNTAPSNTCDASILAGYNNYTSVVDPGCPAINGSTYTATWGGTFEKLCYIDWPTNDFIGNGNDFVIVVSNNFTHCIEACASFNMLKRNSSIPNCVGVSFRPTEATMDGAHLGNCNLKDTLDGVAENVHLNYVVLSALALN